MRVFMDSLRLREVLDRPGAVAGSVLAFSIGAYAFFNYWYPRVPIEERAMFAALTMCALFLLTPRQRDLRFWRYTDPVHAALSVVAFGYIVMDWQQILMRQGAPTTLDMYLGALAVYLIVMACARNLGAGLTGVICFFLFYTFFGWMLPNWAGGHRGYSLERIFTFLFLSENGVLGFAIDTALKYLFLFLLLGKVLEQVGALGFIMDLSRALFGKGASGPPLMAVGSSCLMGTMTGSSMSNVYISGTVTIPLMKRVGLKPEVAAAIEAAASNGSQIMPPVMGFAVFFMITLLELPYVEIMASALIPGTLYFASLFFSVWLRTRRLSPATTQIWDEEPPPLRSVVFSISALSFAGTLGTLVAMLVQRFAVQSSVLWAIAACIAISWLGRKRFGPISALKATEAAGRDLVTIATICLALGLITGPILLTGLGTKLPALLTDMASGQLWLLLIGAFVASLILGAGIPTSLAYVIVALLVATAMSSFGVPKLAAHMFVFYAALAASITPPVALTSYVAATLAGADFWKTGWHAAFLGIPKYFVPFAFVYRPELLMNGTPGGVILVTALTLLGLLAMSFAYEVWGKEIIGRIAAGLMLLAGFLLAVPPVDAILLAVAAACLLAAFAMSYSGRSRTLPAAAEEGGAGQQRGYTE